MSSLSPPSPLAPASSIHFSSISFSPAPSPESGDDTPSPPSRPSRPSPLSPLSPPSPASLSSRRLSTGAVVGIVIGGVAVILVLTLIFFLFKKKRRRDVEAPLGPKADHDKQNASQPSDRAMTPMPPPKPPSPPQQPSHFPPHPHVMSSTSSGRSYSNYSDHSNIPLPSPNMYQKTFTYEELSRATNGFSEANLLGQGGFGYVFKGILRNGKEVAVKQLKAGSGQGEREFQAEVEIISRVHHRNLVTLVGYCIADAQRLLVYEFVPNNTLHFHLHGKGQPPMEWNSRLKIAVGSAKALSYLHENCNPKIIHRDIKAANILIDFNFDAKVADFGLAKIVADTNTHVSTRIMGTFGYLAPEYAASGKLTEKSDVYSFGVILLELITGRRPFDPNNNYQDDNLVDWVLPLLNQASEKGDFEGLADSKMNNEYDIEEMARMVACAGACVRHLARQRPTMDQVVRILGGNVSPSELKEVIKPAKSVSTDYDNEEIKKIRKVAVGSLRDNTSSESSNTTSDFGTHTSGSSILGGQSTREMEIDPSI